MSTLGLLATILLVLMILVGGKKGARSFFALFFNFAVLFLAVLLMTDPAIDPIILTIIASIGISAITLFYINEINRKTKVAFISTLITIVIVLFFIVVITEMAMIQGFGEEEIEELSMFSMYIGVDFVKISAAVIIMSTIGAITDVAISIASPMHEMYQHNSSMTRKELFTFGLYIGRDILGTNTNTLFFAFFGGYLALLIWFKDLTYSLGEIINSKVFSAEMLTIFCAGIGIALIIPITAWISSYYFVRTRDKDFLEEQE